MSHVVAALLYSFHFWGQEKFTALIKRLSAKLYTKAKIETFHLLKIVTYFNSQQ